MSIMINMPAEINEKLRRLFEIIKGLDQSDIDIVDKKIDRELDSLLIDPALLDWYRETDSKPFIELDAEIAELTKEKR